MKTILKLRPGLFEDSVMHLLPRDNTREQAAFLFASFSQAEDVSFNVQQSENSRQTTSTCKTAIT